MTTMKRCCITLCLTNAFLLSDFGIGQEMQSIGGSSVIVPSSGSSRALHEQRAETEGAQVYPQLGSGAIWSLKKGGENGTRFPQGLAAIHVALIDEKNEPRTKKPEHDYNAKLKNVVALWKAGNAREAARAVAELVKTDPKRWEGYALAGVIEEAVNNDSAAKIVYERALILAPETDKPRLSKAIQQLEAKSSAMAVCRGDGPQTPAPCATQPTLLEIPAPAPGDDVRKHRIDGVVRLKVVVAADGTTGNYRVIRSSDASLNDTAIAAASRWKFKPGSYQDKPVATEIELDVSLRLDATVTRNSDLPNAQAARPQPSKQRATSPNR